MQTKIMAIKINYDSREDLPSYLKYSRLPTENEYQKFIDLYKDEDIGGNGFHEGLNFSAENDEVKFYLPPTCIPAKDKINSDFIVFSLSYKESKESPSSIIGVHAGARILGKEGIDRGVSVNLAGVGNYTYHGVSPRMLTTIFTTPIRYNIKDGHLLPILDKWGFGGRYLKENHAIKILETAYTNVLEKLKNETYLNLVEKEVALHERLVIENILSKYFKNKSVNIKQQEDVNSEYSMYASYQKPNREIGAEGEKYIFEKEREYMKKNNLKISSVEWLSKMKPTAVFDIKTVRLINGKVQNYYLEIKSSKLGYGESAYLSKNQIKFFEEHRDSSYIVFVNFNTGGPEETYKTYDEIKEEFDMIPIKYKLRLK